MRNPPLGYGGHGPQVKKPAVGFFRITIDWKNAENEYKLIKEIAQLFKYIFGYLKYAIFLAILLFVKDEKINEFVLSLLWS